MNPELRSVTVKGEGDPNANGAAFYFTVVFDEGNKVCALFFNSKEMEGYHWITALMTSYTRSLRAGRIKSTIKDMKSNFSVHGKYHATGLGEVNSIVHHLGLLLEQVLDKES